MPFLSETESDKLRPFKFARTKGMKEPQLEKVIIYL